MEQNHLISLLRELRPEFGALGTRDTDVRVQQERIDAAIAELERAPSLQAVAWENPSTHAILREESPDMCDNRRGAWNALVYRRPTPIAKPVGTVHVALEQHDGHTEVSEARFEISPDFEDSLAVAPGVKVELYAGAAHVAALANQRAAEAIAIAKAAIDVMSEFHSHAIPDDSPDMDAVFPADRFREFVDEHARLMFRVREFEAYPVEVAYLRLRSAAQKVVDLAEGRAPASTRTDLLASLRDAVYGTDDGTAGLAKPAYIDDAGVVRQPGERALGRMDGLEEAARWHEHCANGAADAHKVAELAGGVRTLKVEAPFSFLSDLQRRDMQMTASHEGLPPNLSHTEWLQFDRAVEHLAAFGEEDYDPRLLSRWLAFGLLDSTGYEVTQTGYDMLNSKLSPREGDED